VLPASRCLLSVSCFLLLVSCFLPQAYAQQPVYGFPTPGLHQLTGNFGEPRHTHLHCGLDIPTPLNTPVYAVADGYVYRIKVQHSGYGRAIYIKHTDGRFSVYAHLTRFAAAFESKLMIEQYSSKSFHQDFLVPPNILPVKKGELVGLSGNTGDSGGPHLHVEIHDSLGQPINPLQFYSKIIGDKSAPYLLNVALQPLSPDARINGLYDKFLFTPQQAGNTYHYDGVIEISGAVGLEFAGWDRVGELPNNEGIFAADLYLDDERLYGFRMDRIRFDDWPYYYQHLDYRQLKTVPRWLQKCYVDVGDESQYHTTPAQSGVIRLNDNEVHQLRLDLRDWHGNKAVLYCKIRRTPTTKIALGQPAKPTANQPFLNSRIDRKTLVVDFLPGDPTDPSLTVRYVDGSQESFAATYSTAKGYTLVLPLSPAKLPKELYVSGLSPKSVNINQYLVPEQKAIFQYEALRAEFPVGTVFDTLYYSLQKTYLSVSQLCSPAYTVGDYYVPVHKPFRLKIAPDERADNFEPRQVITVQVLPDGKFNFLDHTEDGYTIAKSFGTFACIADLQPPVLTSANVPTMVLEANLPHMCTFTATDNVGIDPYSIDAYLDGSWTVCEYYTYNKIIYVPIRNFTPPGKHVLEIVVRDYADNELRKSFPFQVY